MPVDRAPVRPPKQTRTREGWERILDVGLRLLEEGGWEALTISEVCRRCAVSPPSIYARVDGRAGLFLAVYEHGMARVMASERALLDDARARHPGDGVAAFVEALARIFDDNGAFLRAVIRRAGDDPALLRRGDEEAQRVLRFLAGALPTRDAGLAHDLGRMIFAECLVRVMYGPGFLSEKPETTAAFVARLTAMVAARIAAAM